MNLVELAARSTPPSPSTAVLRTRARRPAAQDVAGTSLRRSARQVVDALAGSSGLETWYLGRVDGETLLPLAVSTGSRSVTTGRRVRWSDTPCRRMASGLGPTVAPVVADVPNYARAPFSLALGVTAYAGLPLHDRDGRLLGVLAGWSTRPAPVVTPGLEPVLRAFSELLTQALDAEVRDDEAQRATEREAVRRRAADKVTSLSSRTGWGAVLREEDRRCAERGLPVALLVVDVGLVRSSARLQRATQAIVRALPDALVSRLNARQFGAVLPDVEPDEVAATAEEVATALRSEGFTASTAWATSGEAGDLGAVWLLAEQRLYSARRDGVRP
ncbi:hypothetical protein AB2L27_12490 [Kineococcus sp. LSe6-4]|uniref:GGDEF domain-containing protein n=1 Tax=Kineococcus halophytocola TaxID=3234027 RepID=A0ABV4H1X6_9ACTN